MLKNCVYCNIEFENRKHKEATFCSVKCGNTYRNKLNSKHGMFGTKIYKVWESMKQRCYNPKCKAYSNYGARGITVCEEWHKFICFYEWSKASGYDEKLTIDRIDNNGNYHPSNCKWSTPKEQNNNSRSNNIVEYNGVRKNLTQWSELLGIHRDTLYSRIFERGWDIEKSLTMPLRRNKYA